MLNVTAIFIVVFAMLAYVAVRFRRRSADDNQEPAQIYGSTQVELAWTVIPVLIVLALFLAAARVIASVQHPSRPSGTVEVVGYRKPSILVGVPLSGLEYRDCE